VISKKTAHRKKKKNKKKKQELLQIGVVSISPKIFSGLFEGSYFTVLVSGENILDIDNSERKIWHVSLFSGFGHSSSDSVSIANLEPGRKSAVPMSGKSWVSSFSLK
jgi:hypothetical protein